MSGRTLRPHLASRSLPHIPGSRPRRTLFRADQTELSSPIWVLAKKLVETSQESHKNGEFPARDEVFLVRPDYHFEYTADLNALNFAPREAVEKVLDFRQFEEFVKTRIMTLSEYQQAKTAIESRFGTDDTILRQFIYTIMLHHNVERGAIDDERTRFLSALA